MPEATTTTTVQSGSQQAGASWQIELFLASNESLEIEVGFALRELYKHLQAITLLSLGVSLSELDIYKRIQNNKARLIIPIEAATGSGPEQPLYLFVSWSDLYRDGEIAPNSIALLSLSGIMHTESAFLSPGVDILIEALRNAYNHPNISGIIIETNSGGGESLAGSMLKSAIRERNKPVVGFGHFVGSAAYRALSGADEIIASSEGSEFGSIGTMITLDNHFLNAYRERFADFYGVGANGKNFEFRQALAGNYAPIQNRVDTLTAKFQAEIKRDRPLRGESSLIAETLSGKIFDAIESKKRGLIDGIGNMRYAIKRVRALAKTKKF